MKKRPRRRRVKRVWLDVYALHRALDENRQIQNLSWRQLAASLMLPASLFTRLRARKSPSADALVALLDWLGPPVERFFARPRRHAAEVADAHR